MQAFLLSISFLQLAAVILHTLPCLSNFLSREVWQNFWQTFRQTSWQRLWQNFRQICQDFCQFFCLYSLFQFVKFFVQLRLFQFVKSFVYTICSGCKVCQDFCLNKFLVSILHLFKLDKLFSIKTRTYKKLQKIIKKLLTTPGEYAILPLQAVKS